MAVTFNDIKDLKKQPVVSGLKAFPIPMGKQMMQRRPKVKYPTPEKPKVK
jgi:hypothetical protein